MMQLLSTSGDVRNDHLTFHENYVNRYNKGIKVKKLTLNYRNFLINEYFFLCKSLDIPTSFSKKLHTAFHKKLKMSDEMQKQLFGLKRLPINDLIAKYNMVAVAINNDMFIDMKKKHRIGTI